MPFMGRDWRSPGEAWVKTESLGWQRMKIIESQLYLTACHPSHPACSWPPRSQFGQHMADNCDKRQQNELGNMNCDQTDGETGGICHRRLANSVDEETGSSSSGTSSTSISPTSSPEKNHHNSPALHHVHHPITISSPYGRYSTSCCAYHVHPPTSPTNQSQTNWRNAMAETKASLDHDRSCQCHHRFVGQRCDLAENGLIRRTASPSRGSSSESERGCSTLSKIVTAGTNNDNQTPSNVTDQRLLRHNKSVPDFINTTGTSFQAVATSDDGLNQHVQSDGQKPWQRRRDSRSPSMGNSVQLDDDRQSLGSDVKINLDETCCDDSSNKDRLAPKLLQQTSRPDQDNDRLSAGSSCGGCCCLGSSGQPVTEATNSRCCNHHHHHHHPHHMTEPHKQKTAPHCRVSVRTREVAMHNTISEAFYRLDFYNAIHDIRRFNYICKLLHLLITQNLTSLSGCASRVLFTMLEQVAWEVSANKRNINVIRNLLADLKQTIQKYYCWGRPIGSSALWQQHFETIERISQIVDEIELSPPKSDSYKVTFDKLPVEMIREILLRLNDYRDLVNSAQASPVMRTMIDNQCVWQKLCRYHFTDQQLKLAFESNKFNFVKKQQPHLQGTQLRGIKYARTTSADGRSTYRSPVVTNKRDSSSASTSQQTDRRGQQSEQTDNDRRADRRANSNDSKSSSSSYVTNAVRIFDKERSSSPSASSSSASSSSSSASQGTTRSREHNKENSEPCQRSSTNGTTNDTDRPTLEIDWERVFHQLRKRFDLKEEYADCLLLCRHCRCLFWKSFGHPCIKSDEPVKSACCQRSGLRQSLATGSCSGSGDNNNDYDCDNCNRSNEQGPSTTAPLLRDGNQTITTATRRANDTTTIGSRVSVALLSRNFDRQALGGGGAHENATNNNEDTLASDGDGNEQVSGALSGNARSQHLDNGRRPRHGHAARRQPLDNLNAQLREHNVNRERRQEQQQQQQPRQWQHWQQPNNHRRLDAGRDSGRPAGDQRTRGEELVPKHVTISPQAFLKFFSL